jgi:hypothetical protein
MYRKLLSAPLAILLILSAPKTSSAQELPAPAYRYKIAVHPTYTLLNGLRIDLEQRLGKTDNWLSLGLAGYWDFQGSITNIASVISISETTAMGGAGATLSFKRVFGPRRKIMYISTGLSAHYFDIRYDGWGGFASFVEDGLTFYEWTLGRVAHRFPKLGAHVLFGLRLPTHSRVFVDGGIGLGYSYSFYNPDLFLPEAYRILYGLGRRGLYPTGEFRVGLRLGKL